MLRKKFSVFVILCICVLIMSGGCGGSSHNSFSENSPDNGSDDYIPESADVAWTGAWVASSGTARVSAESFDKTLSVQNIASVFYSCDVENTKGTAKMTSLVILSGDLYLPMFFENLTLSTDRKDANSWTAETPHGNLSITLLSNDMAEFSGAVNYLGYQCEFSATVAKSKQFEGSLKPENMLNGTWKYNEARSGGYRYANGEMSALVPKNVTVCFTDTSGSQTTSTTAGFIEMPIFSEEDRSTEGDMTFKFFNTENVCSINNFYGNIYKITDSSNNSSIDSLIFIQSETQIFMLMSWKMASGQLCILLPLTKMQESEEQNTSSMLMRKWSAEQGGGLMIPEVDTSQRINLTLQSCDIAFLNVIASGEKGTAAISASGVFSSESRTVNINYHGLTVRLEKLGINLWRAVTEKGSRIYVSILSESQAMVIADIVYDGAQKCVLMSTFTISG